jgi:WD40 repeat protein
LRHREKHVDRGCLRTQLAGHKSPIRACAFSPESRRIVTAGYDHTLRLWNVEKGCATGFRVHLLPDDEYAVFTPDGQGFIEVSPDAWRWLGWLGTDPETGKVTRYPAELFGPLPVKGEKP